MPLDVPQPAPMVLDLPADHPPVRLQLRLARAAEPDPTADSREVGPHPRQPRQQVLQLRQLHLELGLGAAGSGREDVENDLGPVHHPSTELALEIGPLHRGQLVVEDHQAGRQVRHPAAELLHFARPDQGGRIGSGHLLSDPTHDRRPRGVHQPSQLLKMFLELVDLPSALPRCSHQNRPLDRRGDFDQRP
jgi:hypothetical protein